MTTKIVIKNRGGVFARQLVAVFAKWGAVLAQENGDVLACSLEHIGMYILKIFYDLYML